MDVTIFLYSMLVRSFLVVLNSCCHVLARGKLSGPQLRVRHAQGPQLFLTL